MSDQIANKVLDMLQVLAAKLGTTVEHVYGLAVRQAMIVGVQDLVWGIGLGCTAFLLSRKSYKWWLAYREDAYAAHDLKAIFSGIGAVIAAVVAFVCLSEALPHLLNPEFFAVRFILQSLGGGK
jgi:hypothetical protein